MKEIEVLGKNVEQAIQNGLLQIGKSREDVDIKIVETGGLFKKAKVVLIYEDEPAIVEEKYNNEQSNENVENISVEENIETKVNQADENDESVNDNSIELDIKKVEKPVFADESVENGEINFEQNEEISTKEEKQTKIVDMTALKDRVSSFLNGLIEKFSINGTVSCIEDTNELRFNISGENVGKLIGYRGDTLNAIQFLLGSLKENGEGKVRIYLDIEGYKDKRAQALIELANKMADKAEEIERNVHLDPMTPYERRIVHTALQSRTLVETESTGEGEKRHVVIKFKR